MHSTLSKPDSQLSTSLFHYCGPVGPWERHGEMHRLERYRSRQFGGSSALNHCLLFKRKNSLSQQRSPIKTTAFNSRNLYFTLSCIVILKILRKKNVILQHGKVDEWPLTQSRRWGGHCRHKETFKLLTDKRKCWASSSLSSNFAQLSMCHLPQSLPLSFSVSPSFTGLAGVQEWLSVAKPNRSSQIHNTPSALSQAWGEQLLIFQRTLHYHSGQNTPHINTKALGCHAQFWKVHITCNYNTLH